MPWRKMRLRDSDVLARVDESGAPVVKAGRVEIRYNARSPKAYHAGASNLSEISGAPIHPDDHCAAIDDGEGERDHSPVASGATARASTGRAAGSATARAPSKSTRPSKEAAIAKGGAIGPKIPEGAVIVYADGACSGNPGPAGLGMVLIDQGDRLERSEYLGTGTNNIAELTAVLRALEASPDDAKPLAIHTDSQYSIGVLAQGWKAKANKELVASIKAKLVGRKNVTFHYVPGHSGVVLNERADELAREAVTSRKTTEQRWVKSPSRGE
jgi:ribonuclease HI